MMGCIIILNGASSSGKTSVGQRLQRLLPEPYLFAGIDSFIPMLRPDGHIGIFWRQRTYDNVGNRTRMDEIAGGTTKTTTYVYDALNRPISITHPSGAIVGYEYDDVPGRRVGGVPRPADKDNLPHA